MPCEEVVSEGVPGVHVSDEDVAGVVGVELSEGYVEELLDSGEFDVKVVPVPDVLGVQCSEEDVVPCVDVSRSVEENVDPGVDVVGQPDVVGTSEELPVG